MDQSSTPTKICTICLEEKPLTNFVRAKNTRSGYGARCLSCESERKRAYFAGNREAQAVRVKRWAENNVEKRREISRRWTEINHEKELERHRRSYATNPEKHRDKVRRSYRKHREERLAYTRDYYLKTKELQAAQNKSRRLHDPTKYALKGRESQGRRRAIREGGIAEVVDYALILKRDGYFCHICKSDITPETLDAIEFDHILPIKKGGAHKLANIAVAHISCNKKKWDRILEEAA